MSKKNFVENFKIQKALGDFRTRISYGDKIHMFNCLYKVVRFDEKGYTMLEDEKRSRFALPSNKLMLMMKKGLATNHGLIDLSKAQISGPSRKVGVTPRAVESAYSGAGEGSGKPGPQGEPVGTTKQGADGQWYKKVSSAPAQWVHVGKGTAHSTPGAEELHPLSHPEDQKKFMQIREIIKNHAHSEDHQVLDEKAMAWAKQMHKYKTKLAYHNAGDVDSKTGKKLPKTGIPDSTMKEIYAEHDKAISLKKELINAIRRSKEKRGGK